MYALVWINFEDRLVRAVSVSEDLDALKRDAFEIEKELATQGAEDDDPQRGGGDEQRGQPGVHVLLGDRDEAVPADEEQQPAGDGGGRLPRAHAQRCAPTGGQEDGQQQGTGQEEPATHRQERRQLGDGVLDHSSREVRFAMPLGAAEHRGLPRGVVAADRVVERHEAAASLEIALEHGFLGLRHPAGVALVHHDDVHPGEFLGCGEVQTAINDGTALGEELAPVGEQLRVVVLALGVGLQPRADVDVHRTE